MTTITGSVSQNQSRYTYRLLCEELNPEVSSNSSQLQVTVQIVTGGTSGTTYATRSAAATHTVIIDGISYTFTTNSYSLIGGQTLTLGSVISNPITHESDGSKTVSVIASSPDLAQGSGWGPYSGSASGDVTLSTLHKAPSDVTYTITETNTALTNAGIADNVFVKDLSIKSFAISATLYDSATVSNYMILNSAGRYLNSSSPLTINFKNYPLRVDSDNQNKVPIVAGVIDSLGGEGLSSDVPNPDLYTSILYNKITITETNTYVKRKGQSSGRLNVNIQGTYYNGSVGNKNQGSSYKPTIKYKFWKVGSSEPSTFGYTIPSANVTISNETYSVTNYDIGSITESAANYFDPDYAYRVKFYVQDYFTNATSSEKQVPVGESTWTEYKDRVDFKKITIKGNDPFEYSTTPVKVGTYKGKDLYRAVISETLTLTANSEQTIAHNISGITEIRDIRTCYKLSWATDEWVNDAYLSAAGINVRINKTNIIVQTGTNTFNGSYEFTIDYTIT